MRWFCWILIALFLSCTTGCSCGGGHSSLAEMKRRALRNRSADDAPAAPPAAAPSPSNPAPPEPVPAATTPAPQVAVAEPVAPPPAPKTAAVAVPPPQEPMTPAPAVTTSPPAEVEAAENAPPAPAAPMVPTPTVTANAEIEESAIPTKTPVEAEGPDDSTAIAKATGGLPPSTRPSVPNLRPSATQTAPAVDTRLPIPDSDAQSVSKRLLADLYKDEYDQATTPDLKKKLAAKLMAKANEVAEDSTGHYLQIKLARDLAVQAGDVSLTIQAINALAANYQFDGNNDKVEAFESLAKAIRSQADAKVYFAECKLLVMACVRTDDFVKAGAVLDAAELVAKRGKMSEQLDTIEQSRKVLEEMRLAYAVAQPSFSLLAENADDAAANLAVGRYRCYYRRDWQEGLQNLALSNDVKLRVLAQIDASHPATSQQQSELADQWYEHSQAITKTWAKSSVQLRAAYWYQLALPGLPNGLVKSRVQKRLSDIASATGDETIKAYVAGKRNVVPLD